MESEIPTSLALQPTKGNLVDANSTQLTTIVSIDPIYANFYPDEASVMRFQDEVRAGKLVDARQALVQVWLQLEPVSRETRP